MRAKFPLLVILGALLVACSDAPAPTVPADIAAGDALFTVLEGDGAVYVLNAQLRPVASTDFTPSTAWGHIQVKLRAGEATPPDDNHVSWQGRIFNPDEENVSAGGIFFGFQAPPDDGHPPPDDNEVLHVINNGVGTPATSDPIIDLFGETTLEAADAADMIASPGAYFVWFTTSAGAIAGEFHMPPPDDG